MTAVDLSDYNLAELKGLQLAVALELRNREVQARQVARDRIADIADGVGLSVQEVLDR